MSISPKRQAVIDEAQTWMGTPFHHQARVKGAGVDCGQLLIGVYGALGYVPIDYKVEYYSPQFAFHREHHRGREWYLELVTTFSEEVPKALPGDAVLFKWGALYSHGGIVVAWPKIIHAWAIEKKVMYGDGTFHPLGLKEHRFFRPFGIDA